MIQAPKGTRDFYPADLLRRRYIERLWREASIRHGFEEVEGPTFESSELYKVKSGEGILGEMFGVFSGKSEEDVRRVRDTGEAPLGLRPEFTPTLARMAAGRAGSLSKPTRWFTMGAYFRAERPQRGRLREFHQWNVDVIGEAGARADGEVVACAVEMFREAGLGPGDVTCRYSSRSTLRDVLVSIGLAEGSHEEILSLLDKRGKMPGEKFERASEEAGLDVAALDAALGAAGVPEAIAREFEANGIGEWCVADAGIVRGLAYYTGLVFEVVREGERAVAGGGRYDNLIELFGGGPLPAVGFGMGDVVLGNLLEDKGLMPEGAAMLDALGRPGARLRPDVFVVSNGSEEAEAEVRPLVARLRRGEESEGWLGRAGRKAWDVDRYVVKPLHARRSSRATKNIGKLLEEASKQHARHACIVEGEGRCTLKDLSTGEQVKDVPIGEVARRVG